MAIRENDLWDAASVLKRQPLAPEPGNHKRRLDMLKKKVAGWEYRISLAQPRCRQVIHLIEKFGGILPFSIACNRHPNHIIYLWLGVTSKGAVNKRRWGLLPSMGMALRLVSVARSYGILLTPDDLMPDILENNEFKNPYANPDLAVWAAGISPKGSYKSGTMQYKLETEIANLIGA